MSKNPYRLLDTAFARFLTGLDREVLTRLLVSCERDVYAETVSATGVNPGSEGGTT